LRPLEKHLGIAGVIGSMGVSLFPFLLPSSSHPQSSLTVYHVMRGPVTNAYIEANRETSY
jgi:cytochrome bd-type quinol oxidase subunit 2